MSRVKGLVRKIDQMIYSKDEKLKEVLNEFHNYQMGQIAGLLPLCQEIESCYPECFNEENPEFKEINERLNDLEKKAIHKFLQNYGETIEYDTKQIVFEAIDDIIYEYTYTGENYARDILYLQQIFGIKFEESQNKEEVAFELKKAYGQFEEKVGEEKASALVYALAGPDLQMTVIKYLDHLVLLKKTLKERELFSNLEIVYKRDFLKIYDKHRIKFQEILVNELYKDVNGIKVSPKAL